MAQPSSESLSGDPLRPESLFERTRTYLSKLLVLSLVPLATALGNVSDLLATARTDGISITASFPIYRYDLWSFIDAPDDGGVSVAVPLETVGSFGLLIPLLLVYITISGALTAGYFGSIADGITTGTFDFMSNVRQFGVRLIALELLVVVGLLVIFLPLLVIPPLFILGILVLLVCIYLFFPTVYVLVLEDCGIESAARRAYGLVSHHQPLGFFLTFVGLTLVCSIPLNVLARAGLSGAVVAAIIAAPLGLAFNIATALKVADMAGVETERQNVATRSKFEPRSRPNR